MQPMVLVSLPEGICSAENNKTKNPWSWLNRPPTKTAQQCLGCAIGPSAFHQGTVHGISGCPRCFTGERFTGKRTLVNVMVNDGLIMG